MVDEQALPHPSRVHVVDDDDSFRSSMVRLLAANDLCAIGYRCAGEFLIADPLDSPGCILLDISMPGPSGIDLLNALHARRSSPPVILITGWNDVLTSVDAMKSGAVDYIVKPACADRILSSVRRALHIDHARRAMRQEIAELRQRFEQLSPLERRIFLGVAHSKLNKQLAAELGSCERTIKAHRARIRSKLHIRSLPDLVRASKLLEESVAQDDPQEPVDPYMRARDAQRYAIREPQ